MNVEIYFPREGTSFAQTSDKSFENTVKKLGNIDVNIIYKTEVNLNSDSIGDALKVTDSGEDKIEMIVIADALKETTSEKAKEFFENLGIIGKVRNFELDIVSPQDSDNSNNPENKLTVFTAEYGSKLIVILPDTAYTDFDFNTIIYTAMSGVTRPKQKNSFWKRFIPCQGDGPIDVVRKVILLLAICTFVVSSYMLLNLLVIEPAMNDKTTNGIRDLLVSTTEGESSGGVSVKKPIDGSEGTLSDFQNLLSENPDTIGWVTVPNTVIDYVVVKPQENQDPEYYLYRDFYGNDTKYGTIFMDYRSQLDSKNLILHGHHMQDGRMFANLKHYDSLDFYKSSPTFTFNTIYEKAKWKIVSVFKTNTLDYQGDFFNYLRGEFTSDYDFLNFVYELRERSIIDCPVDVNENDTLCTLSTCTYDFEEFRFVVVARKVRDGESANVDISKAKLNEDPLYPNIWYNSYGGTKPEVTTFQDAYNKGKINWYDGKRNDFSQADDDALKQELNEGKENAIKELTTFIKRHKYEENEKQQVDAILNTYTNRINDAKNGQEVNTVYNEALQLIRNIKTSEEVSADAENSRKAADAQELANKKSAAIVELGNSIAGNTYRIEQAEEITRITEEYTNMINAANDSDEIDSLRKEGIAVLSKIKTDAELKVEELSKAAEESRKAAEESSKQASEAAKKKIEEARSSAISDLNKYASRETYYTAERTKVKDILTKYVNLINKATTNVEIESYLKTAKSEIDAVKTSDEIDKERSSAVSEISNTPSSSTVESSYEPSPAESSYDESSYDESSYDESSYEESSYDESSYDESSYEESSYDESSYDESSYDEPEPEPEPENE